MPNYFGYGIGDRALSGKADLPANFERYIDDVKSTPGVDYTALVCGFWYEFSLAMGEPWFGFRIRDRSVTMYGDGMKKVNVSTWDACGRAVAGLLSLPVAADGTEGGVALEKWKNNGVYISSFLISQRDILDSLHRVLGTRDTDWTIRYDDVEKRFGDGMRELGEGKMLGFAKALYAGVWRSEGADYECNGGLNNGALGMEKEDLDRATKRAVEMAMGPMGDIEGQFR